MFDTKFDEHLGISTRKIRNWKGKFAADYYRLESTAYEILDHLGDHYQPSKDDVLVDIGAGSGRVSFYVHQRFNIEVRGIEVNDLTFTELKRNKKRYLRLHGKENKAPLSFYYAFAEFYDFSADENIFYFFNPFTPAIFKQVLHNIEESLVEDPRVADLILYYPDRKYLKILEKSKFELEKDLHLNWKSDARERILIYRHLPE